MTADVAAADPSASARSLVGLPPISIGNDSMSGATNLGTVRSASWTGSGHVGGSDRVDYWKFRPDVHGTSSNGKVRTTVNLWGLSQDLDVHLVDGHGRVIARGTRAGNRSEKLTANLDEGRQYYLKVFPYRQATSDYRLTVSTGSNDSMAGAIDFGKLERGSFKWSGSVGGSDRADYWKFRLPEAPPGYYLTTPTRTVSISLSDLDADLDIHVMDANGRVLARGTRAGSRSENLRLSLPMGGEYFVKVFPYRSAVSDYDLTISMS